MAVTIAIMVWFVAAGVALVRPKWGVALIWPAIWLYPNTALYGTLPLNVRLDDLWMVFMFLLAIFYARGRSGTGPVFWLAMAWAFSLVLGDFAGFFITGGIGWQQVVKGGLKTLYVPMTAYILTVFIREERDVWNHLKAMGLAAAAAAILSIAMVYFPTALRMFLIPSAQVIGFQVYSALELIEAGEIGARRAQGAVGTMTLAAILMSASLLALCMLIYRVRQSGRGFFAVIALVCLVGLGYTATRGAIGGFVGAILWGMLFTRRRGTLIAIGLMGAAILVVQGGVLERVLLRVTGTAGAGETPLMAGLAKRFVIWGAFVDHFSPIYLFTGMGMSSVMHLQKATAHNSYLGAFVYGGMFGVAVMVAIIVRVWKLAKRLRMAADAFSQGLGVYLAMFLVGMMLFGMVVEMFQHAGAMQMLFAATVLADRRLAQVREAGALPVPGALPSELSPGYAIAQ